MSYILQHLNTSRIKYLKMASIVLEYENQSRPKAERQVTYFCRLCREYGIKTRKVYHLEIFA